MEFPHNSYDFPEPAPVRKIGQDEYGRSHWCVIAKTIEDANSLHEDMESPEGTLYIPNREVEVVHLRPTSRITHYMLTKEESELLKSDPRVESVELHFSERGMILTPTYIRTPGQGAWDKTATVANTQLNWGLLRCTEGVETWGSTGTQRSGSVELTSSGKNVDVVIADGFIDYDHPEFAKNPDGTGGTRVVKYNWFQHNPQVTGGAVASYSYDKSRLSEYGSDHGTHVAGIACGNTQGWAWEANIYNIDPYSIQFDGDLTLDYIKEFHKNKPINPETGRKNPTIVNMSYGLTSRVAISTTTTTSSDYIKLLNVGGTSYNVRSWTPLNFSGPGTIDVPLNGCGMPIGNFSGFWSLYWTDATNTQVVNLNELLQEGVICINSAGNNNGWSMKANSDPSSSYNDWLEYDYADGNGQIRTYPHRGNFGARANGCIVVGATSAEANDSIATFSDRGESVTIFAPGVNIMSSYTSGVPDRRSGGFKLNKQGGTSMAAPQVTGVIACLLETYPNYTSNNVLQYLSSERGTTKDQILIQDSDPYYTFNIYASGSTIWSSSVNLVSANNHYLYYYPEKPRNGSVYPKINMSIRPESGQVWPRTRLIKK